MGRDGNLNGLNLTGGFPIWREGSQLPIWREGSQLPIWLEGSQSDGRGPNSQSDRSLNLTGEVFIWQKGSWSDRRGPDLAEGVLICRKSSRSDRGLPIWRQKFWSEHLWRVQVPYWINGPGGDNGSPAKRAGVFLVIFKFSSSTMSNSPDIQVHYKKFVHNNI